MNFRAGMLWFLQGDKTYPSELDNELPLKVNTDTIAKQKQKHFELWS